MFSQVSVCPRGRSLSVESPSRGVSVQGGICPGGGSVQVRRGLCLGWVSFLGSLSRGVSVGGGSVQGQGVLSGGSLFGSRSLSGVLCPGGVSVQGGLCPGVGLCQGDSPVR